MLSFWNETLKNIAQDQRKDKFLFIVNNAEFEVPLSYALAISPRITQQYLKDPAMREFHIIEEGKMENEFLNFINGKEITNETFIKIGIILKNQQMLKKWKKSNESSHLSVIKYIKSVHDIYQNSKSEQEEREIVDLESIKDEIKYIGKHFEEMKEEIQQLSDEELIYLIRNEDITLEREDTIWEIIRKRLKDMQQIIDQNQYESKNILKLRRIFLENVQLKNLNNVHFKEYIEEISNDDLYILKNSKKEGGTIWNQIQEIILNNIIKSKPDSQKEKEKSTNTLIVRDHEEGKNFNGIIKYLQDKYGKNIYEQGLIDIIVSSTNSNSKINPEQVINFESQSKNGWYPRNEPNQWWEINFKKMKVKMNGYSIKTSGIKTGSSHLKNWVIEGNNEGEEWEELDRQNNNNDLNGPFFQNYYSIGEKTKPYQYIRLKNIGQTHYGSSDPELFNFEIYGELDEESND